LKTFSKRSFAYLAGANRLTAADGACASCALDSKLRARNARRIPPMSATLPDYWESTAVGMAAKKREDRSTIFPLFI